MPKETVNTGDGFDIRVGWTNGSFMQVGVECDGGRSIFWQLMGDEWAREKLSQVVTDVVAAQTPGAGPTALGSALLNALDVEFGTSGLWASPDRAAVNRVIRLLRKGRDAAFGTDA